MSYSGDPGNSDSDFVRFLIGDTDTSAEIFTDDEIDYAITYFETPERAAYQLVNQLIAAFSRNPDKKAGGESISYGRTMSDWRKLKESLALKAGAMGAYAGGISKADIQANEANTDMPTRDFNKDDFIY